MGKSALCNLLTGHEQNDEHGFKVTPHFYSNTSKETNIREATWRGCGRDITIIDTPGTVLLFCGCRGRIGKAARFNRCKPAQKRMKQIWPISKLIKVVRNGEAIFPGCK